MLIGLVGKDLSTGYQKEPWENGGSSPKSIHIVCMIVVHRSVIRGFRKGRLEQLQFALSVLLLIGLSADISQSRRKPMLIRDPL